MAKIKQERARWRLSVKSDKSGQGGRFQRIIQISTEGETADLHDSYWSLCTRGVAKFISGEGLVDKDALQNRPLSLPAAASRPISADSTYATGTRKSIQAEKCRNEGAVKLTKTHGPRVKIRPLAAPKKNPNHQGPMEAQKTALAGFVSICEPD